jgi:hypothetical protein
MRARITALLLCGALLAGAQGTAAAAGGATVMWQNPKLTVTVRLQPLTITFKNRIASAITFSCSFWLDSEQRSVHGRLRPFAKMVTQPANGVTASLFSCRTRLAS